jgi:ferrous iron transport protein A
MQTLDQLTTGQRAKVMGIGGEGPVRRRIMDMGVVKGVEVEMVKASPLGDPVEYRVRGYSLSLRKSEAQLIEVEI